MLRHIAFAALLLASACSAAPDPIVEQTERAYELVWTQRLGMEVAVKPVTTWLIGCSQDLTVDGKVVGQAPGGLCVSNSVHSDGTLDVMWTGSVSSSDWAAAIVKWRNWLMTSSWATLPTDDAEVAQLNAELAAAGL